MQEVGCKVHVPGRGPCHAPCHDHVPLELGPMELQLGQLAMEQAQVDQQLEQTLMERVLERMLVVVRHGVMVMEALIWRIHNVPRGLPEPMEPNQPAKHQHPEVVMRL